MRTRYGFVVAGGGGGGGGGEEIIRFATRRDRALPGNNGPHSMFDPMRLSRRRGKNERGGEVIATIRRFIAHTRDPRTAIRTILGKQEREREREREEKNGNAARLSCINESITRSTRPSKSSRSRFVPLSPPKRKVDEIARRKNPQCERERR